MFNINTGWGAHSAGIGQIIGNTNIDDATKIYDFEMTTYPATKKITIILLIFMYNALGIDYRLFQMDISLYIFYHGIQFLLNT